MIINALYNIVDSIFVAKYSQDALAAVSLVYPLQMLVVAIGVGTGVGVNSLIARRLGEKRQKHADSAAEHGVALAVVGGIAFFILGMGTVRCICRCVRRKLSRVSTFRYPVFAPCGRA